MAHARWRPQRRPKGGTGTRVSVARRPAAIIPLDSPPCCCAPQPASRTCPALTSAARPCIPGGTRAPKATASRILRRLVVKSASPSATEAQACETHLARAPPSANFSSLVTCPPAASCQVAPMCAASASLAAAPSAAEPAPHPAMSLPRTHPALAAEPRLHRVRLQRHRSASVARKENRRCHRSWRRRQVTRTGGRKLCKLHAPARQRP